MKLLTRSIANRCCRKLSWAGLLATATLLSPIQARAERQVVNLESDWKFIKQDVAGQVKTTDWESVSIPHTWNAVDGANGKGAEPQYFAGYYRGPAWYARSLPESGAWKGKRAFIRFEGVCLVSDVFVNDIPIGQHRGAFAAFCFEITPYLHFDGKDTIKVRVDNSRAYDVAPLSGDFTTFGGIYRPVKVITTDEVCVSPLEYASPGVLITTKAANAKQATVEVKTFLSNAEKTKAPVQIETELRDATGKSILSRKTTTNLAPETTQTLTTELKLDNPQLWQGRKNPYLYSVATRVLREGKVVDEVTQPLGIRTVSLTQDRGFLLNGETYPLHGVNYHQDLIEKGWATSDADRDKDMAMIMEVGATTIRLAHYQQSEHVHDLSDRNGMIEWQEIPLVDTLGGSPQFLANARQQLTEMIYQDYNHPSIGMWGLFNELDSSWAQVKTAPSAPIIANLGKLAKELDPTRLTVAASSPQKVNEKHHVPDGIAWNVYPGWYSGSPDDASKWIGDYITQLGGKRIGISEYGAGANPAQFQEGELKRPKPDGPFHPQEWQNYVHERLWAQWNNNPRLWGTWIWVMFDFAVDGRNEGSTPGLNDKGLVTRDRKTKKDTFYFYKANWNPEPMLYITSRRATPRKQASTEIKLYSNCSEVELKVNGQSLGMKKPDDIKVVRWPGVTLQPGKNTIEAIAKVNGQTLTDSCEWHLESAAVATP